MPATPLEWDGTEWEDDCSIGQWFFYPNSQSNQQTTLVSKEQKCVYGPYQPSNIQYIERTFDYTPVSEIQFEFSARIWVLCIASMQETDDLVYVSLTIGANTPLSIISQKCLSPDDAETFRFLIFFFFFA